MRHCVNQCPGRLLQQQQQQQQQRCTGRSTSRNGWQCWRDSYWRDSRRSDSSWWARALWSLAATAATASTATAEDFSDDSSKDDDDENDNDDAVQQQQQTTTQQQDEQQQQQQGEDDEAQLGVVETQDFCRRNYVSVHQLKVLCDTPGAYYYGSNAYRNSPVCTAADKLRLTVEFEIPETISPSTIYVQVELGNYDHYYTVATSIDLCQQYDLVVANSDSYASIYDEPICPEPGTYAWSAQYGVPAMRGTDSYFVPDVKLTFWDAANGSRLGCVATGPVAIHLAKDGRAVEGLIALAICVSIVVTAFGVLLYLQHRKRQTRLQPQYFRTLPSGHVLPLPRATVPISNYMRDCEDEDDDSNYHISNPAYNETQIPTRPII